jgi:hypothetical protein
MQQHPAKSVGMCRGIEPGRIPSFVSEPARNPSCEFMQFVRASLRLTIGNSPPTPPVDRVDRGDPCSLTSAADRASTGARKLISTDRADPASASSPRSASMSV